MSRRTVGRAAVTTAPALAEALAAWVHDVEVEARYGLRPDEQSARGHRDGLLAAAEQVRTIIRGAS